MPKRATDYSRTVIYKLEHMEKKELVYVGSTTDFINRKSQHKHNCNNEKQKNTTLKFML
jgi:predicted GIY-YIG superfamily endonuclease